MTCSHCDLPTLAIGLCSKHYNRQRRYGSPDIVLSPRNDAQAFIRSTKPSDECVQWPFKSRYASGYGAVTFEGRLTGAHRAVCILHHGAPPSADHQAAHSCGNKLCVNPAHIRWATQRENESDKRLHGTSSAGEANGQAKLTVEQVQDIRAMGGSASQSEIARRFTVSRRAIGMILANKTWRAA